MAEATAPQARGGLRWAGWLLLVLLAVVLWPPARHFLFVNEANNAVVGQQVLLGQRLYSEAADWKGPLGYLLYAVVLRVSGGSVVAIHLAGLLLVLGLVALTARLAVRVAGPGVAPVAAAFTLVYLANSLGPSVEMDLFMAFFAVAGYLCFAEYLAGARARVGLAVAAGVLLVLAFSAKQIVLLDLVALGVSCLLLWRHPAGGARARAGLGWLALGAGLGLAVMAGLIWRYSAFHDYLVWSWIIPFAGQKDTLGGRVGSAGHIVYLALQVWPLWALAVPGAVAFWRGRRKAEAEDDRAQALGGVVLPLWLLVAALGMFAGNQPVPYHLTQAAAPCSVLAVAALVALLRRLKLTPWPRYVVALLVVALGVSLVGPLRNAAWRWRDRVLQGPEQELGWQIGQRLAAQTTPEDYVYVLTHDPSVTFWCGRRSATRYCMVEHVWMEEEIAALPEGLRRLMGPLADPYAVLRADLQVRPPKYLLIPNEEWLQRELQKHGRRRLVEEIVRGYRLERETELYLEYRREGR